MVLVGSSFGSSGILFFVAFFCVSARCLSVMGMEAIRWPRRSFVRPVARCDFVFGWVLSVIGMEELAGQADRAVRAAATLLYLATMHGAPVWRVCVIWRSPNASVQ